MNKSSSSELNPVQLESSRSKLTTCLSESEKRASAQIPIKLAVLKSLETISGMILSLNQLQLEPKFGAKSVANEMQCLKAKLRPALSTSFSFDLKLFLSNLLLRIIIYSGCVTK